MTQEQKEQLAKEGVTIATNTKIVTQEDLYHIVLWALNARDEEVEELEGKVRELTTDKVRIMCERDSLYHEHRIEIESLRKEIEQLKAELAKQAVLLEERGLIKFANLNAQLEIELLQLRAELKKAKNPWVSVEERLPDEKIRENGIRTWMSELVFVRYEKIRKYDNLEEVLYGKDYFFYTDNGWLNHQFDNDAYSERVTHWMPILKGGEV